MDTTDNLGNFSLIVLLVVFIYALMGMQLFGGKFAFEEEDYEVPRSNFDTLLNAITTVFQVLTGEDWNTVMYYGIRSYGLGGSLYFISLVVVGNYVVVNLFIAILLSSFAKRRQEEHARDAAKRRQQIQKRTGGTIEGRRGSRSLKGLDRTSWRTGDLSSGANCQGDDGRLGKVLSRGMMFLVQWAGD
eukprot:scaffold1248_cov393-Prasinococcus_capsulatus_cf.AAC.3